MASSPLATSLVTSPTAAISPVSSRSHLPVDATSSSEESTPSPTPAHPELGMTTFSSPTSVAPSTATLVTPNSILPSATSPIAISSTSATRGSTASSYSNRLLSTSITSYSMASVPSSLPTPWPAPTTTVPLPSTSLPSVPSIRHHPMMTTYIAVGAGGGAALLCICLVVILIACATYKTGCKTRRWKRLLIRNRRNTEYMHRDAFWAGASQGPKELPKEDQNALHRNGTIKDGQEQGRHVSPVWNPGQGSEVKESTDGGNDYQMQEGGWGDSQNKWTFEPQHPRISETSFNAEHSPPLHASFNTGSHPSQVPHFSKSCSPPQVPAVMPLTVPAEGVEPVAYVNLQHAKVQQSSSEPLQKMAIKKKPVPFPRPAGSQTETVGYVNVGEPLHSQGPVTMPRERSGYTPVLIHDVQLPQHAPGEGCYDVPRSAAPPLLRAGSLPHGIILSTQVFNVEADSVLHSAGAGKTNTSHYDIPKGNSMKKAGKVPPFVAPKPQTTSSHNNSLYDCPKGTPMQVFPAAILSGAPHLGSQYPENIHAGGASQYDNPHSPSHLLTQRDEPSSVYDAPRVHSPTVQYQKAASPSALSALRRESQYDVPKSPFQLYHGNGNPDMTEGYDTLAQYPIAEVPAQWQPLPHSALGPAQQHSTITGHQPARFRLPPIPGVTTYPSNHSPSGAGHYDVPRSPHGPAL